MEKEMEAFYKKMEILEEADLLNNPMVRNTAMMTHLDNDFEFFNDLVEDSQLMELAEKKIKAEKVEKLHNPFTPKPKQEDFKGRIPIGYINERGDTFNLNIRDFASHFLIVGSSGTGKSLFCFCLILCLYFFANIIFFDRKREYRSLLKLQPEVFKVIKTDKIAFNPLEIHGENFKQGLHSVINDFCINNKLLSFSKNILIEEVIKLYYYIKNPTLDDVIASLKKRKPRGYRESEAISSLLNRLTVYKDLGMCNYKKGFSIDKLFDNNAIIELDGVTDEVYSTVISYFINQLFRQRLENNIRDFSNRKPNIIVVDEARLLFPNLTYGDPAFGNSSLINLFTIGREFGIYWILLTQEPTSLSPTILSNSGTTGLFPLSSGVERLKMAKNMSLDQEQIEFLPKLPPYRIPVIRSFIYPDPFLIIVPEMNINKDVTDDDIDNNRANQEFIDSLGAVPNEEKKDKQEKKESLSPEANYFLVHISMDPFRPIKILYREAGLSAYKGNKHKKELIEKGYVKEESLNLGKHRPNIYLSLTEKAYKLLGKKPPKGKGSFIHKLLCHKIKAYYENKGFEVKLEKDQIDLVVKKLGETIAVEVTLHHTNLSSNIMRNLNAGYNKIMVVFKTKKELDKGKDILFNELGVHWQEHKEKISFEAAEKFL